MGRSTLYNNFFVYCLLYNNSNCQRCNPYTARGLSKGIQNIVIYLTIKCRSFIIQFYCVQFFKWYSFLLCIIGTIILRQDLQKFIEFGACSQCAWAENLDLDSKQDRTYVPFGSSKVQQRRKCWTDLWRCITKCNRYVTS